MNEIALPRTLTTGNATAKKAAAILVDKQIGFLLPTPKQRQNLLIAFVKKNMVVYGRAFDIIKLRVEVDLNDHVFLDTPKLASV